VICTAPWVKNEPAKGIRGTTEFRQPKLVNGEIAALIFINVCSETATPQLRYDAITVRCQDSHGRVFKIYNISHVSCSDILPGWDFKVQIMPEKDAANYRFHPFDLSKVWPHGDYPLIDVGVLELNCNPENYHAEVEQAAFNPASIVPGIGFSPDKILQGRLFSYGDTQRYRLGLNHAQIPVNKPRCPVASFHRDGMMRVDGNYGSTKAYEPNSLGLWQESPEAKEPPLGLSGAADNWNYREDDEDYYTQPGMLFRIMSPGQQQVLFDNTAAELASVDDEVRKRHIRNCMMADPAYGEGVAKALGIALSEISK
jgi:catalase